MREVILAMLLAASAAGTGEAAGSGGATLAPGQAAGVHPAQLTQPNTMLFIGLGVLVVGAGLYLASGTYKTPGQSNQNATSGTSP